MVVDWNCTKLEHEGNHSKIIWSWTSGMDVQWTLHIDYSIETKTNHRWVGEKTPQSSQASTWPLVCYDLGQMNEGKQVCKVGMAHLDQSHWTTKQSQYTAKGLHDAKKSPYRMWSEQTDRQINKTTRICPAAGYLRSHRSALVGWQQHIGTSCDQRW